MKNIYIRSIVAVVSICLVMGLALAVVYKITKPIIDANELKKSNAALAEIFPGATFEEVFGAESKPADAPKTLTKLYKTADGTGYVAYVETTTGYGKSTFAIGIDATTGTITKIVEVTYGDSIHFGQDYLTSFEGKGGALSDVNSSASPAKFTRAALQAAAAEALAYATGGEVPAPPPPPPPTAETLTEAQLLAIFSDADSFEKVFDNLTRPQGAPASILALYKTADGTGYVAKIETVTNYGTSTFAVGVDASTGTVVKITEISYGDSIHFGESFLPSFIGQGGDLTDVDSSASPAKFTKAALKTAVQATLAYIEQMGGAQS